MCDAVLAVAEDPLFSGGRVREEHAVLIREFPAQQGTFGLQIGPAQLSHLADLSAEHDGAGDLRRARQLPAHPLELIHQLRGIALRRVEQRDHLSVLHLRQFKRVGAEIVQQVAEQQVLFDAQRAEPVPLLSAS